MFSTFRINLHKAAGFIIILLLCVLFKSCNQSDTEKNCHIPVSFDKYAKTFLEVQLTPNMPKNIAWVDNYVLNKDTYMVFLDYLLSEIHLYDTKHKVFDKTITIPITSGRPNLIKFVSPDSIIYYTIDQKELIFCNEKGIKLKYTFLSQYNDYFACNNFSLIDRNNNWYSELVLENNGHSDYNLSASRIPNFYTINLHTLQEKIIPVCTRIKESNTHCTVQETIKMTIDKNQNRIIYSNMMSDTLYEYNISTQKLKKILPESSYHFTTLFFNSDTCQDIEICRSALFEKSSSIVNLYYSNKYNFLYRIIKYYCKSENKKLKILQIFNAELKLIKELHIDDGYEDYPVFIDDEIYFYIADSKHKKHVYKKLCMDCII